MLRPNNPKGDQKNQHFHSSVESELLTNKNHPNKTNQDTKQGALVDFKNSSGCKAGRDCFVGGGVKATYRREKEKKRKWSSGPKAP